MTNRMLVWGLPLIFAVGAAHSLQAQDFSVPFPQGCSNRLPADTPALIDEELDQAERALAARDAQNAGEHLERAVGHTMDVAGYSGALSVKCVGEPIYRRWFEDMQRLIGLQAQDDPQNTRAVVLAALWIAATGNGAGADSILTPVPTDHSRYRQARSALSGHIDAVAYYRKTGAFVLPVEDTMAKIAHQVVTNIDALATKMARTALAEEENSFHREFTQREKDAARQAEDGGQLISAIAGVDMDVTAQLDAGLKRSRVNESKALLREARGWNLRPDVTGEQKPANIRAEQRGDEVLAWAENKELSYAIRDDYYRMALDYYTWGNWRDKAQAANTAKKAIQPQLQAEEARRREAAEKAQERMRGQAEEMQQAIDDMQKTEEEKKSFQDEADALEAELGF
jgi:hypothetical protein